MPASASAGRFAGAALEGNKESLPSKPCTAWGRDMTWRKRWSRSWSEVKFCSDACRKGRTFQTAAQVADAMVWLRSDQAARMTGQVIAVDGGFTTVRPLVK